MQKRPAPVRRDAARNGSIESRPRYGLSVTASASGGSSPARLDERGRVRARGRADVAALRVGDDEQPGGPRVLAHLLERAEAVAAERLEERRLRLHRDGVGRDRVDDAAAEAGARGGRVLAAEHRLAAELHRELVGDGIETDDELAVLALDRLREPVAEMRNGDVPAGSEILRHRRQGYCACRRAVRPSNARGAAEAAPRFPRRRRTSRGLSRP